MAAATTVIQGLGVTALGLAAAALWGMSDFLGGLASRRASVLLVIVIAHGLSAAALTLTALGSHAIWPDGRLAAWGLLTGISGGLAVIAFYRALAIGEMGLTAALAGVLTAMVPVIFSYVAEGRPKTTQIFGFALAAAAIWCIAYQPGSLPQRRGLWLAALAGLGFGAFLVTSKFASQGAVLWPLAISRISSAALALALLGVAHWRRQKERAGHPNTRPGGAAALLLIAGGAGLLEALGNLLYMLATRAGRLDVAAVLSSLYPAITILLAVWLLKEHARAAQAWGMVLAMAAVVVISL